MFDSIRRARRGRRSCGWQVRGVVTEEHNLINTVHGTPLAHHSLHMTVGHVETGAVIVRNVEPVVQCYAGCVIDSGQALAFCAECGRPTCRRHSVCDSFCARVICLPCSRLLTIEGLILRVCPECYRRVREGLLRRVVRLVLGPDDNFGGRPR